MLEYLEVVDKIGQIFIKSDPQEFNLDEIIE